MNRSVRLFLHSQCIITKGKKSNVKITIGIESLTVLDIKVQLRIEIEPKSTPSAGSWFLFLKNQYSLHNIDRQLQILTQIAWNSNTIIRHHAYIANYTILMPNKRLFSAVFSHHEDATTHQSSCVRKLWRPQPQLEQRNGRARARDILSFVLMF